MPRTYSHFIDPVMCVKVCLSFLSDNGIFTFFAKGRLWHFNRTKVSIVDKVSLGFDSIRKIHYELLIQTNRNRYVIAYAFNENRIARIFALEKREYRWWFLSVIAMWMSLKNCGITTLNNGIRNIILKHRHGLLVWTFIVI